MDDNFGRPINTKIIMAALVWFTGAGAHAETVYFGDADRGPGDTLQIGDVTVSRYSGAYSTQISLSPPATVSGSGLGAAVIGPNFSIDGRFHYSVGDNYTDTAVADTTERLLFCVAGDINSITIVPHFPVVMGTGEAVSCGFGITWMGLFGLDDKLIDPSDAGPITISIPHFIQGFPIQQLPVWNALETSGNNMGQQSLFVDYRDQHLSEDQTIEWGFTILSMDYTPIPEPGTVALLGVGLFGLWCARRQRTV